MVDIDRPGPRLLALTDDAAEMLRGARAPVLPSGMGQAEVAVAVRLRYAMAR